ncbi:MAG: Holliday junction branch migration protein RuvA [Candidatus Krumholzibacteria bacterium]|nr:Holliday junction branch migration protein RuvA [Candidatus Krumholzibacteria bacterium]
MISTLEGRLAGTTPSGLIVDVGGVGLEVHVPAPAAAALGAAGERVRLFTHLHVREDALTLYGFANEYDRTVFLELIGVSGIGPRVALTILSQCGAAELSRLIRGEDVRALVRLPGIGRKTAERLVVELKDRLEPGEEEGAPARPGPAPACDEAVAALMSLGLTRSNAARALERIVFDRDPATYSVEEIVRLALRAVPL